MKIKKSSLKATVTIFFIYVYGFTSPLLYSYNKILSLAIGFVLFWISEWLILKWCQKKYTLLKDPSAKLHVNGGKHYDTK